MENLRLAHAAPLQEVCGCAALLKVLYCIALQHRCMLLNFIGCVLTNNSAQGVLLCYALLLSWV